jgi:6-pyruvoyl-tetrahydropterin synthase
VERNVRLTVGFDAGHKVEGRKRCQRQHGHHWTLTAETRSRRGDPDDIDTLITDVDAIVAEWRDRDLNEMIHNFNETTPENLAPWVMERLLANHYSLTLVEVSDGIVTASVHREPPLR